MGADLKAPQKNEAGQDYWSYWLIKCVAPRRHCLSLLNPSESLCRRIGCRRTDGGASDRLGAARFGGACKEYSERGTHRLLAPAVWIRSATASLPLSSVGAPAEIEWLRGCVNAREHIQPLRIPFQLRNDGLRAGQGYLFKTPADFVEHWTVLWNLADALDERAEELSTCVPAGQLFSGDRQAEFRPKMEADYTAVITAAVQRRTRTHERLVRLAGEWLQARGARVTNAHPKDLEIVSLVRVIIEVKVVRQRDPLFAASRAVGDPAGCRASTGADQLPGRSSAGCAVVVNRCAAAWWSACAPTRVESCNGDGEFIAPSERTSMSRKCATAQTAAARFPVEAHSIS